MMNSKVAPRLGPLPVPLGLASLWRFSGAVSGPNRARGDPQ